VDDKGEADGRRGLSEMNRRDDADEC
jgi:hypothetical protein